MIRALRQLGIAIEHDPTAATIHVTGCAGRLPGAAADLYVANSGTTVRFLTALLSLGYGTFRLDGSARMRERRSKTCSMPCGSLVAMLFPNGTTVVRL